MRAPAFGIATLVLALVAASAPAEEPAGPPGVGDAAPAFTLPDQDGKEVSLAGFRGKETVVLAFYPKDFTGG